MRPTKARSSIFAALLIAVVAALSLVARDSVTPAGAAVELLPNLKALPAHQLMVEQAGATTNLRFSITSWNAGAGVLELRAGEVDSQAKKQRVYQRVYSDDGSFRESLAGSFVWHQGHFHTHFEGYALYTLQPVGAPGGSSRIGSKTTFCIIDTDHVDSSLPGSPGNPVYTTCSNTYQGLSVGWGDTYSYVLQGQEIDVTGLPAGDYQLTLDVDPNSRLEESNETDNSSTILIRLDPAARTVSVLPDADSDAITDPEDNCPRWANPDQALPDWPVPEQDADCDGFTDDAEAYLGTHPALPCAADTTAGNEPSPDRWPVDLDDNRTANTIDVGYLVSSLNSRANQTPPDPRWNQRHDLDGNGVVNVIDVGRYVFVLNKSCSP